MSSDPITWKKLTDVDSLAATRMRWTPDRCRLVWVNGCWDLLHVGHVTFLRQAASFGDILVVGINDDASVRRLKGADRPIVPLRDRLDVLCELECVDYLVTLAGLDPCAEIEELRPDVLVKGAEYGPFGPCACPEAEIVKGYGGRIEYLPKSRSISTTEIVTRVRALKMEGGR